MYGRILLACLVLVPLGCNRPTGPVAVAGADEERDLVRQIATHKHWTKPVSESQVEGWVREIEGLTSDGLVEIEPDGKASTETGAEAAKTRSIYQHISPYKRVVLNMRRWDKQPSRLEILEELKRQVDQAAFRPERPKDDSPFGD